MSLPSRLSFGMPAIVAVLVGALSLVADASASIPQSSPSTESVASELPAFRLVARESIAREPVVPEPWVVPVQGYQLTSRFGDSGSYWSSGSHTGLDFAAGVGSPIRSVASGVVVSTAYDGAYGVKTVVRLPDGTEVWYCHQDTQSVAPGQQVRGGQVIGTVGATGNVTGPHLHLEVRPGGGDPVDPEVSLHRHRVEA
jgi:murein DD-endopeptidase MepM/ murein hydrolase activator NlpD